MDTKWDKFRMFIEILFTQFYIAVSKMYFLIYSWSRNYPKTVAESIDDNYSYPAGVLEAVAEYKAAKPWRGDPKEKLQKVSDLYKKLSDIYKIPVPALLGVLEPRTPNEANYYDRKRHIIVLDMSRFSVVTALHEFGHATGLNERGTAKFSLNLFKRVFPKEFAKLGTSGHTVVRQPQQEAIPAPAADSTSTMGPLRE